jgi:hypothetical protein
MSGLRVYVVYSGPASPTTPTKVVAKRLAGGGGCDEGLSGLLGGL